jgi:hypothetical protein
MGNANPSSVGKPGGAVMAVVSIKSGAGRPSITDLIARATEIAPFVRAQAEQTENNRQVSSEVMARLREAGLFKVMTPAVYGGYEYGFDALVRVAAPIGAACGSTGWVFSLGIVHQWLAAMFPKQAQDEFWSDPDALLFGSYPPVGKVEVVDGGYRISGNWSFTSGCDHATWLVNGGMIPPRNEGAPPTPAFFLLPMSEVRIDDNWYTMGLAGTGSKNSIAENVFVPAHRVVTVADLCAGTAPGGKVHDNPLYRHSMMSALPFTLVTPVLGMAEGALADFVDARRCHRRQQPHGGIRHHPKPCRRGDGFDRSGAFDDPRRARQGDGGRDRGGSGQHRRADTQPAGAGIQRAPLDTRGRRDVRSIGRAGDSHRKADPAGVARCSCGGGACQHELGRGEHDVRPARPWSRSQRAILEPSYTVRSVSDARF